MRNVFRSVVSIFKFLGRANAAGVLFRIGDRQGAIKLMNDDKSL